MKAAMGVSHGSELPYVFGGSQYVFGGSLAVTSDELAKQMSAYWRKFAASQNPNSGELPEWKKFLAGGRETNHVLGPPGGEQKIPRLEGKKILMSLYSAEP